MYKNSQENCRLIATEFNSQTVKKLCLRQRAKLMQYCINVKSSRNDKVRHLARKGRNKKQKMCKELHSELNSLNKFKKVNNPLTKHTDPESEKLYQKIDA